MPLFDNDNNEVQNPLEHLVGEGKKFKSVEDLAKGKLEADQYIKRLEEEQAEIRRDLEARVSVEEALKKLTSEPKGDVTPDNTNQERQTEQVDIDKLVTEKINQYQKQSSAAANEIECDRLMTEKYGDKAKQTMEEIARQRNIPLELVRTTAQTSVAGFKALMGLDTQRQQSNPGITQGNTNTAAMGMTGGSDLDKELEDLNALRKTNPRQYWKPAVQNRIMKIHASRG